MLCLNRLYFILLLVLIATETVAQAPALDKLDRKTIIGEPSFQKKSKFFQWLWGRNRRVEWATAISVPILWLDTVHGGLKPYEEGGGNESKSLRVQTANGEKYTLRSIKKSREEVIPPVFKYTFGEDIIKDGVSCSHPYGALALAVMQEHAGIHHTLPSVIYLPKQAALDTFNDKYGNHAYLFEQRAEDNWSNSANLGNFSDFSNTLNLIKKLLKDNIHKADQYAFIRARLFDMLISDWDRHEGNLRWGKKDSANMTLYEPVPNDRDQAFYSHNGIFLDLVISAAGLSYMQHFDHKVKNIEKLNFEERNLDRFFTNALNLDDWMRTAINLQQSLTDTVITKSVQRLPPEIFAVSGNELIEKLKSRRKQLVEFATTYYLFLAREVEVVGSSEREYFEVKGTGIDETVVSVFRIDSAGQREDSAYYKRTFKPVETKEIRLYGIADKDVYVINDNSENITIRIIGGPDKDSLIHTGSKIHIYDDRHNSFQSESAKLHLSSDSGIHAYKYDYFQYNSKGFRPVLFYNYADRLYVGLTYSTKNHKWRREPFANQHTISIFYSISQNALSASYAALYPKLIGNWDLLLNANFDAERWTNFYGLGNETISATKNIRYYRIHSKEWLANTGLRRAFGKHHVDLAASFQHVNIRNEANIYPAEIFQSPDSNVFAAQNYGGLRFSYSYMSVNDSIVPTKGFSFSAKGDYLNNFTENHFLQNYSVRVQVYFPISKKFSLAIRAGGSTIVGNIAMLNNTQLIQHAVIGGPQSLRGYRMERFWGKTSFYNNNELRFITNLRTWLLNAKAGLIAFFDNGRVWMPNESSNTLHTSYGGGLLLAPFHKISLNITYGISNEARLFQVGINKQF